MQPYLISPRLFRLKKLLVIMITLWLVACQTTRPSTPAPTAVSLTGRPLKGSQPAVYRLMEDGRLRHIYDWPTYLALGYRPEDMVTVTDDTLATYSLDLPLTRWLTSQTDPALYLLKDGRRYHVPNLETLEAMGGSALEVSLVPDEFLQRFEAAAQPLPALVAKKQPPDVENPAKLPGQPIITAQARAGQAFYSGTNQGDLWLSAGDGPTRLVNGQSGWVSALAVANGVIWYADSNHFDRVEQRYHVGRGLVKLDANRQETVYHLAAGGASDPLNSITALTVDPAGAALWVGTRFAGLLRYDLKANTWQTFTSLNSPLLDNAIVTLALAQDNSLWAATPAGVSHYYQGTWASERLAEGLTDKGVLALTVSGDTLWVGGDNYIAWKKAGRSWQVYTALDHPLLADKFGAVALDDQGWPWFVGHNQKIHFDGQRWTAYSLDMRRLAELAPGQALPGVTPPPRDFPSPTQDYTAWLKTWPRPPADNGRGLHFLQTHWFDEFETRQQVARMQKLGVRWTLVNYANRYQLMRIAPIFKEAGIMVIWRPYVRPYQSYDNWAGDVEFLRRQGLPPYIQLYNEPSLGQEWDESHPLNQEIFLNNLLPAVRQVYDAGGYVGLQSIDPGWLRVMLRRLKAEGMTEVFDRLFFVPHPYGLNHPPEYDADINSVLGFRAYAQIFKDEIGFTPVMIAGEGGWRPGEAQDNRYPIIDEKLHRNYHLAVFDWFRAGQLSNGELLPDYLLAFCPWLISDPTDPAAWFDSASGDRTLTIEAIQAMPEFERKFSWNK